MLENAYINGEYLEKNPGWHIEESPWKALQIERMLKKHNLTPQTICEVGCGVGEVLKELQKGVQDDCILWGYDISPQAISFCTPKANERLHFKLADIRQEQDAFFDLLLVLDVFEHLEDCFGFLRALKSKGQNKIFHIPLDISLQSVLRPNGLLYTRDAYGHIHYYTKETAIRTLQDAGYEVIDYFYTRRALEIPPENLKRKILLLPRKLLFNIHQDLAARILGGFSLLVLAR
ncbi:MAG: class I SAM-dependent methyltransferase [Chloroflexi bacterium]|nr:MAG: class I SAM-dependent methyltransferase [Chloroflexota bacterium]